MKRHLIVLLFVVLSSCTNEQAPLVPVSPVEDRISVLADNASASPLKVSSNSRYLTDQSGAPVFLSGDAAWSLIVQVSSADADYYLQNRAAYGFNFILVNLIEHQFSDHPPSNYYNQRPFTGTNFTTPNPAYFQHVDDVLTMAANRGITVLLFPAYTGYNCGAEGWCAEMKSASTSAMLSWGQYVGNRYKNFSNIVWCIGGDADPSPVKSKLQAMVDGIRQTDPNHLITAHNAPESYGITPWSGQLNINTVYTYSNTLYTNCRTAYNYSPRMPYFMIESAYEREHNSTPTSLRSQAYWSILSGGCGEVFGNNPMWLFGSGWKNQLTSTGSASMKYLAQFFRSRHWQYLVPDFSPQQVMTSGAGSGTGYAATASASDGSSIVVYLPSSRTVTINTNSLTGSQATCWWYNPSTGAATSIGTFTKGSRSFTPPSSGDWVFLADATVLGFQPPGSTSTNPMPTGTFSSNTTSLPPGGGSVTLSWTSQNATSASMDNGIGSVATSGSRTVNVTATTTYTLTLSGSGGTRQYTVTINVGTAPLPSGTIAASPNSLPAGGGQVTLTWTSQNATSASINQGIGPVATNGSLNVNVTATKTFTVTFTNAQGMASYNATVTVGSQPPPPGTTEAIYTETSYSNAWNTMRSWSVTLTPGNTSPVQNGTTSLKVVHSAWGSLQFSKGTWGAFTNLNPADYTSFSFWVNGGSAGVTLNVSCINSSNGNVKTPVTLSVPANAWVLETIPMSSLATTSFVAFAMNAGGSSVTFYLDDIILNK